MRSARLAAAALTGAVVALSATAVAALALLGPPSVARADAAADPSAIFAEATAAIGGPAPDRFEKRGTVEAAGLRGTVVCREAGVEQLCDTRVGPLVDYEQRSGDEYWRLDVSGLVRRLDGVLLAHLRTSSAIEDFSFLAHPEWARVVPIGVPSAIAVDVRVPGGDTERVIFDRADHLVREVRSTVEDGTQTLRFSHYRTFGMHRVPVDVTIARGTGLSYAIHFTDVALDPPFAANAFTRPISARVRSAAIQTVPLSVRDEHLYVPVTIGGRQYSFLLDSGSRTIVLDERVARAVGFASRGDVLVRGARNLPGMGFGMIEHMRIADAELPAEFAVSTNLATTTDGSARIDGILGFPIFAQAALELEPGMHRLRIGEPGSLHFPLPHARVSLDRGIIEIAASLHGAPSGTRFILDTGSSDTFAVYGAFARRYPNAAHIGPVAERTYGLGGSVASRSAELTAVDVSGFGKFAHVAAHVLEPEAGAFSDRLVAGNVGMGIFGSTILGFDLQNGVVSFGATADEIGGARKPAPRAANSR